MLVSTGNTLKDIELAIIKRIKGTGFEYSKHKKENIDVCNLCGSHVATWSLYSHRDRYGLPVRSMRCNDCGLIFITPRMNELSYSDFYKNWYRKLIAAFSGQEETDQAKHRSLGYESDIAMAFLSEYMSSDMVIENVLDVGGSIGAFAAKVCKTLGCKGTVVDPNASELKEALNKGLSVCCSSFGGYVTETRYDLIAMLRTVEHLPDISKSLQKCRQLLTEKGMFLIDIVNHEWLMKMFKEKFLCTKIDHVFQFTDNTVCQYLDKWFSGYEIIKSDTSARYVYYLVKPK